MLMGLNHDQFLLMKKGTKKIEIRLNDEKRSDLKVGEAITFRDTATNEKLTVTVEKINKFETFRELYSNFDAIVVGSPKNDSLDKMVSDTYTIYSPEQEKKYGVLALKVNIIDKEEK